MVNKGKICSFEDCDRPAKVLGMCRIHYSRQHRMLENKTESELEDRKLRKSISSLKAHHNLEIEDVQLMWDEQGHKCAVCSKSGPELYSPGRLWVIDHDHACCLEIPSCGGCFRGVLCNVCNVCLLSVHMTEDSWERVGIYLGYIKEEGQNISYC